MHRPLRPPAPRRGRQPRFLRRRQPVPLRVLAALCAALAAPVSAPALLATGATALLAASAPGTTWANSSIPGIGVVIKKNKPPVKHMAETDQDGRYDFKDLEPGAYDLLIEGQPPRKVVVGKDGQLRGVVTGPARANAPREVEDAPAMTKDPDTEAGRTRFVADAQAASDKPRRAAMATPPADAASSKHEWEKQALTPKDRQTVQAQALADGYHVKLAGQSPGFKLNTVKGTIEELPAGVPARPAADAPAPAPARLQAWLVDLKTGQVTPLASGADGFALPSGLEDGRYRYALKVSGGGGVERPCPPACSGPGYLTISIEKGSYKGAGDPKFAGF